MARMLTVAFGTGKTFDFTVGDSELAGSTDEASWRWFDNEYAELDCKASSPVGKVLVIDKILNVAKFSGERRFENDRAWADAYARHASHILGRDKVRVDVGNASINF
jgi:hypothetical protein